MSFFKNNFRRVLRNLIFLLAINLFCYYSASAELIKHVKQQQTDSLTSQQKTGLQYTFIDANKQLMLGNTSLAQDLFLKCIKIDKNNSASYYQLAFINYSLKNFDKALTYAKQAVLINPKNKWYSFLLASIYQQLNDFDNAVDVYHKLIKYYPQNYDLYFQYSSLLALDKKYSKAIKVCNKLEATLGFSEKISLQREKIYLIKNDMPAAYKELNKLIAHFPGEPKYYLALADAYVTDKNFSEALKVYNRLLKVDPDNGDAHFFLAQYYIQQKQNAKSFEELKKVFSSNSFDVDKKLSLYLSFSKSIGNDKELDDKLQKLFVVLLKTNPDNTDVQLLNSDYLFQNKEYTKVQSVLESVIEQRKDNFYAWQRLIVSDNLLQDFKSMYAHSSEAITYFPNQSFFYLSKGLSAYQIKNYQSSVNALEFGNKLVVQTDPLKKQFYLYLGESNYQLKNYAKAFHNFDEYLKLDPDDTYALNNYSYYLSLLKQNLNKAEQMSKKTVTLEPKNSTFLDTYAWVLFQSNKFSKALDVIKRAIINGGDKSSVIVEHYGDILFKNNKIDDAVTQWKKAKSIGSTSKDLDQKIKTRTLE